MIERHKITGDASGGNDSLLEKDCQSLRLKLQSIQRQRRQLRKHTKQQQELQLQLVLHETERTHQLALDRHQTIAHKVNAKAQWMQHAIHWNVINDCFHIWHRGPYATINGLRLGISTTSTTATNGTQNNGGGEGATANTNTTNGTSNTASSANTHGHYANSFMGSLVSFRTQADKASPSTNQQQPATNGNAANTTNIQTNNNNNNNTPLSSNMNLVVAEPKIPWVEINSALGLVVLLLTILERKPHSSLRYQNKLVAMGSTSRIGIQRNSSSNSYTFYNLYSDDSFAPIFGKRSFNIALNGILQCLWDASKVIHERDRTMMFPHAIENEGEQQHSSNSNNNNNGSYTIGGSSIAYDVANKDPEEWTRAMKYLLTNVKWLIAYTCKHVDG